MREIAERLASIPGVVAVTLGGSRATGSEVEDSDWDFGLYYRNNLSPHDVASLGWPGQVFAPGDWGRIVNGGAWLEIDGVKVDLIYRNLDEVLHWTAEAEQGRFEIQREVGYVAGISTYVLAGELALCEVLAGEQPRRDRLDLGAVASCRARRREADHRDRAGAFLVPRLSADSSSSATRDGAAPALRQVWSRRGSTIRMLAGRRGWRGRSRRRPRRSAE